MSTQKLPLKICPTCGKEVTDRSRTYCEPKGPYKSCAEMAKWRREAAKQHKESVDKQRGSRPKGTPPWDTGVEDVNDLDVQQQMAFLGKENRVRDREVRLAPSASYRTGSKESGPVETVDDSDILDIDNDDFLISEDMGRPVTDLRDIGCYGSHIPKEVKDFIRVTEYERIREVYRANEEWYFEWFLFRYLNMLEINWKPREPKYKKYRRRMIEISYNFYTPRKGKKRKKGVVFSNYFDHVLPVWIRFLRRSLRAQIVHKAQQRSKPISPLEWMKRAIPGLRNRKVYYPDEGLLPAYPYRQFELTDKQARVAYYYGEKTYETKIKVTNDNPQTIAQGETEQKEVKRTTCKWCSKKFWQGNSGHITTCSDECHSRYAVKYIKAGIIDEKAEELNERTHRKSSVFNWDSRSSVERLQGYERYHKIQVDNNPLKYSGGPDEAWGWPQERIQEALGFSYYRVRGMLDSAIAKGVLLQKRIMREEKKEPYIVEKEEKTIITKSGNWYIKRWNKIEWVKYEKTIFPKKEVRCHRIISVQDPALGGALTHIGELIDEIPRGEKFMKKKIGEAGSRKRGISVDGELHPDSQYELFLTQVKKIEEEKNISHDEAVHIAATKYEWRRCGDPECPVWFQPKTPGQKYHSRRCYHRCYDQERD